MNLEKLIELNSKGLITDEALAAAVNEYYGKEKVDRRQELIEKNRKHTEELRRKIELQKENKELSKEYEDAIKFLSTLRNSHGKKVYSKQDLDNMSSLEAVSLAEEIKPVRRKENLDLFKKYYDSDGSNLSDEQLEEYALKCKLYELNNVLTKDKRISADNILAMPVKEVEANLDKLNGVEPEKEAENAELTDEQKKAINNLPGAPVSDLNPEKPKKVSKIATAAKKLWNIMTNNKAATIAACAALAGIVALAIVNPSLAGALVVGGDIYKGYKGR